MIGIPQNLTFEKDSTYDAIMIDHAAGNLSCAQTLVIDSYISMNDSARADSRDYLSMGGALLDSECKHSNISGACFENVMNMIDVPQQESSVPKDSMACYFDCDFDLLEWKTLAPGIEYYDVPVPCQKKEKAQLLKMAPGKSVLEHSHDGLELTLVLDGAFHDDSGVHNRGDLSVEAGHDHAHKPVADMEHGCICLAVTTAPLHFTGLLGRVINPFVR
jgi:putative transcriptional regulator